MYMLEYSKLHHYLLYTILDKLQLSFYCEKQIEQLVSRGVGRMGTGKVDDHAGYVLQAERNLKSLIKYFCDYSLRVETFPALSNSHFNAALNACPTFWPYTSSA